VATTIAAISSPPGGARRGVVRLSGPDASGLLARTVRLAGSPAPPPERGAFRGRFLDGRGEQPLLLLWMPGPRSYTREDVAELHLPGAPPLVEAALARLLELGAEPALPGEFTRRAFLNGRLDLTRAEGVLALVEATNEGERRAAAELLAGGLERRVDELRDGLVELRTLCEASLDFDEADTGHVPAEELAALAEGARAGLVEARAWEVRRQPPSALPRVALVGAPNAGKSSLFNRATAGSALVGPEAGTTRDWIAGLWRLPEREVLLVDAPGIERDAVGPDARAQELAARERSAADLALVVVDGAARDAFGSLQDLLAELPPVPVPVVFWNQLDRPGANAPPTGAFGDTPVVGGSALRGDGLVALSDAVSRALAPRGEGPPTARPARELFARHRAALERALAELDGGRSLLAAGAPLDLVAEAFRGTTDALDAITGRTSPEDLLDRIFARFCLGK